MHPGNPADTLNLNTHTGQRRSKTRCRTSCCPVANVGGGGGNCGALGHWETCGHNDYGGGADSKMAAVADSEPVTRMRKTTGATCASDAASPARCRTSGWPTAGADLNAASVTRPMATVLSWHGPQTVSASPSKIAAAPRASERPAFRVAASSAGNTSRSA